MFGSDEGRSRQINGPNMFANASISYFPFSTSTLKNLHRYWKRVKLSSGICVKNSDMKVLNDMVLLDATWLTLIISMSYYMFITN